MFKTKNSVTEFDSQPTAPTTEGIHAAMRAGRWAGSVTTRGALEVLFKSKHIEQFNFGPLSLDTIHEAQREAMDFIEYGCLELPYPECVFRCSVGFDNRTVGFHVFCVKAIGSNRTAVIASVASNDEVCSFRSDNTLTVENTKHGRGVPIMIPKAEVAYWEPHIGPLPSDGFLENTNAAPLSEGPLLMMGLTMILNTRGVLKERTAPPAKPNKVRAARGAPLIPYTTKVYTGVYNAAVRNPGEKGSHASPRPHRRRAHIRHYPKTDKHEAYIKPVAAMLINWDGQPLPERAEYEIK